MDKVGFIHKRAAVIVKAWTDPVFRKTLIANPKEVIAREFALDLPADLTVTILEDSADTVHLVLVDPVDLPEEEKAGPKAAILAKAWTDPAFRQALLDEPAAALAAGFGAQIRPGVRVKVVEQTDDHMYAIIPFRPATLSDADLDKVAGGMSQGNAELLTATVGGVIVGAVTLDPLMGVATAAPVYIANYKTVESDGKWVGKESVKVGKSIGHACKKAFHGW